MSNSLEEVKIHDEEKSNPGVRSINTKWAT